MFDSFSKFAFCYPVASKTIQNFLRSLKHLYLRNGFWEILHSINGSEFVENRVDEFARSMGSEPVQEAPYRPQTQGQIERFYRTIKSKLRRYLETDNRRYEDVLDEITFNIIQQNIKSLDYHLLFSSKIMVLLVQLVNIKTASSIFNE
ncbi:Pol polyprotein [Cucumispora dikerogammari]|nr:Pol polyprotein [Cucumispora dikerogammari]